MIFTTKPAARLITGPYGRPQVRAYRAYLG
jgi:hypothetical protein